MTSIANLSIANQFLIAASIVVFGLMAAVGLYTGAQIEHSALSAAGSAGAARMQTSIAPLLRRSADGSFLFDEQLSRDINLLIGQGPEGQRITNVKIWLADGTTAFSVHGERAGENQMFPELEDALAGKTVVSRTVEHKHEYSQAEMDGAQLEIYAPLVIDVSGKVALAGEIYLESKMLEAQISRSRAISMIAVFLVSVPMLSLLYLIVRRSGRVIEEQRQTLRESLRNAIDLSIENNRLRLMADNARVEAGKLNERILDQIGADLHDGSLQVLTLVKLRLSDLLSADDLQESRRTSLGKLLDLVSMTLEELRNVSAGLILPELEHVSVREAIELALKRYLEITGCEVKLEFRNDIDLRVHDLSICLYRFVLEGLMNSYRHARGNRQMVRCELIRGRLYVSVADFGARQVLSSAKEVQRARLGKVSQKRRIRSFGGRMRYFPRPTGSIAVALLPINA
ncbi:histidine kinase (plasmid) [Rhizobium sp. SL42]|nr:histidine kinase [Rhizobium sp. SL42]